jgi:hypothetical protein
MATTQRGRPPRGRRVAALATPKNRIPIIKTTYDTPEGYGARSVRPIRWRV